MDRYSFLDDQTTGQELFDSAVSAVNAGDFYRGDALLRKSMLRGYAPAYFNSALLNGQGCLSPYNIDFAAECFRISAQLGHGRAQELVELLNKADIAHLTFSDIANLAAKVEHGRYLNPIHTIIAARYFKAICEKSDSFEDVIFHEMDVAAQSDFEPMVYFVQRTGIDSSDYTGARDNLDEGSPPDIITDGLFDLSNAMERSGAPVRLIIFQQCSIVGYLISKSSLGRNSKVLLGIDDFFGNGEFDVDV